jgi:alpha-ketoglutarate-dependent taurine dioxygenase
MLPRRLLSASRTVAPWQRRFSTLLNAAVRDDALHCRWSDGAAGRFHLTWLQDHCPSTVHPDSGQRTVELRHLEGGVAPKRVEIVDGGRTLALDWPSRDTSPNSQRKAESRFDATWLRQLRPIDRAASADGETDVTPWEPFDLEGRAEASCTYHELCMPGSAGEAHALSCLRALRRVGFCVVSETPPTEEDTLVLARRLGRLQGTFYGEPLWDTAPRPEGEVRDTAYTTEELPLHTDCTYMQHTPGIQLFNCVRQASQRPGSPLDGATKLADGFKAAEVLRRDFPSTFAFFCRVPLPFIHQEGAVAMRHAAPVFELHAATSEVSSFRYNELDRAPFGPPLSYEDICDFYTHQAVLVRTLDSLSISHRLEAGDTILVDNHRVLHGRHAFVGPRNLIGCYLTADDWKSRWRVLEATLGRGQGSIM